MNTTASKTAVTVWDADAAEMGVEIGPDGIVIVRLNGNVDLTFRDLSRAEHFALAMRRALDPDPEF